jgi:hypothetical protein
MFLIFALKNPQRSNNNKPTETVGTWMRTKNTDRNSEKNGEHQQ